MAWSYSSPSHCAFLGFRRHRLFRWFVRFMEGLLPCCWGLFSFGRCHLQSTQDQMQLWELSYILISQRTKTKNYRKIGQLEVQLTGNDATVPPLEVLQVNARHFNMNETELKGIPCAAGF